MVLHSTWNRRLGALLAVALLGAFLVVALPAPGQAATADEAKLLSLTNSVRAANGAGPLALDGTLSNIARNWAQQMANAGGISHNASYRDQVDAAGFDWRGLAENVGFGGSVDIVHQALVNSPSHFTNLTNPKYTIVGIGIVTAKGSVWIVEDFLGLAASAPAAPAASEPAPTPAPTSPPATAPRVTAPPTTAPPETTTTTTTTIPPTTTTTTTLPVPTTPPSGLPLLLTQLVQQMRSMQSR